MDTSHMERLAVVEAEVASVKTMLSRIEAKIDRSETKIDQSIADRAAIGARLGAMDADITRAHRKIDGIYSRMWAVMTASVTALVAAVWDFLKKG